MHQMPDNNCQAYYQRAKGAAQNDQTINSDIKCTDKAWNKYTIRA